MTIKAPSVPMSEYFDVPVAPHMQPVSKVGVNLTKHPRAKYKTNLLARLLAYAPRDIQNYIIQIKTKNPDLETTKYENGSQLLLTTIAICEIAKLRTFFSSKLPNKLIEMLIKAHGILSVCETLRNFARQYSIETIDYPKLPFKDELSHLNPSASSSPAGRNFRNNLAKLYRLIQFFDVNNVEISYIRCTAILNYCAEQKLDFNTPYYLPSSIKEFQQSALKRIIAETLFAQIYCDEKSITFTNQELENKFQKYNLIKMQFTPSVQEALASLTNQTKISRHKITTDIDEVIYRQAKSILLTNAYQYPWFYQMVNEAFLLMQYGIDKLDIVKQLENNILTMISFCVGQIEFIKFLKTKYNASRELKRCINGKDTDVFIPSHVVDRIEEGLKYDSTKLPADIERLGIVTINGYEYDQKHFKSLYHTLDSERATHGHQLEQKIINLLSSAGITNELVAKFLCHQLQQQALYGIFLGLQSKCAEPVMTAGFMLNPNALFKVDIQFHNNELKYKISSHKEKEIRNLDGTPSVCELNFVFETTFKLNLETQELELTKLGLQQYSVEVIEKENATDQDKRQADEQAIKLTTILGKPECWGRVNQDLKICQGLTFNLV